MDDKFYLPQFEDSPIQEIHGSLELEAPIWYDKVSPWKKCLNYFHLTRPKIFMASYLISLLIVVFGLVHLIFYSNTDKNKVSSVFSSVNNIMTNPPISELFLQPQMCKNAEQLNLGKFPGTVDGCYYSDTKQVEQGTCVDQKNEGDFVPSTSSFTVSRWKGFLFCAQRYSPEDYYFDYTGKCDSEHRRCGKYLCVKGKCPISSLTLVDKKPTKKEEGVTVVMINRNQYFVIERNDTQEPIITFHISVDGNPCLDLDSTPIGVDRYPLINAPKGCGYGEDSEVRRIDNSTLFEVLKPTEEGNQQIENLPLFSDYLNDHTAFLVGIPRLKLASNSACWKENIFAELDAMGKNVIILESRGNLFFIAAIFITFGITFLTFESRNAVTKDLETLDMGMKSREGRALGCGSFFFFIFSLLFIIYITPDYSQIISFKDNINSFLSNDCFENKKVTDAINDFAGLLPQVVTPIYVLVILETVITLIPCIIIIMERFKEKDTESKRPLKKSYK